MGRIVIELNDKLEEQLRLYISRKYPLKPYGKLKQIIEEALKLYLEKTK